MVENFSDEEFTAVPSRTLRRYIGKVCQFFARKIPFIPGKWRAALQNLHGVKFVDWRTVFIGENVTFDDLYPENVDVGKYALITTGVIILTHYLDTSFQATTARPFRFYKGKVIIEDYVFIGANTVITKPLVIGEGAIIGANSVLTTDVPPYAIMVGSPARQVGFRPKINLNKLDSDKGVK